MTHEQDRLTVRRWAADAFVNGEPFEEAALSVGDHLVLGCVEMEVVADESAEPFDELREHQPVETNAALASDAPAEKAGDACGADDSTADPSASWSWGNDTIHHTTVWVGEEEAEAESPATDHDRQAEGKSESDERLEPPAVAAADVVPGQAVREVFRELQTATAISRTRCRKLIEALRIERDAYKALLAQVDGLNNTKDELVAEYSAAVRERNLLHEQLATAEQRYADWDHQTHQFEVARAEWDAKCAAWEQERSDWITRTGDWESRLANHVRRIEELESQLAQAVAPIAPPAHETAGPSERAAAMAAPGSGTEIKCPPVASTPSEPVATKESLDWANSQFAATTTDAGLAQPLDMTVSSDANGAWPTSTEARHSQPEELRQRSADVSHAGESGNAVSPLAAFLIGAQATTASTSTVTTEPDVTSEARVPAWRPETDPAPPAWERQAPPAPSWDDDSPSWSDEGPTTDVEPPTWESHDEPPSGAATSASAPSDTTAAADASVDQGTVPVITTPADASLPGANTPEDRGPNVDEKLRPVSYIERFAHLFTDETANEQSPPEATPAASAAGDVVRKPSNMPIVRSGSSTSPTTAEDEESLEDYMAKLMQRVRGERPVSGGLTAVGGPSSSDRAVAPPQSAPTASAAPQAPNSDAAAPSIEQPSPQSNLTELVRRAPVVEQPTDLKALRALANETARRAIGVHATKKHRRDAVTKFIVASLAGMTSIFLMMLASHWRDMQFIAACVSFLIAAYWAGQAYAKLVEMSKAGDYDGPEFDDGEDLNPPLPIDV